MSTDPDGVVMRVAWEPKVEVRSSPTISRYRPSLAHGASAQFPSGSGSRREAGHTTDEVGVAPSIPTAAAFSRWSSQRTDVAVRSPVSALKYSTSP